MKQHEVWVQCKNKTDRSPFLEKSVRTTIFKKRFCFIKHSFHRNGWAHFHIQPPSLITSVPRMKFWLQECITMDRLSLGAYTKSPSADGAEARAPRTADQSCPAGTKPCLPPQCHPTGTTSHGICQPLPGPPLSSALQSSCVCFSVPLASPMCLSAYGKQTVVPSRKGRKLSYHWHTAIQGFCLVAKAKWLMFSQ